MTDLVERLRTEGRVYTHMEAAAEIERLRAECQRLAGEVSRAHKDALAWMEKAAAARREGIEAARQQGRIEGAAVGAGGWRAGAVTQPDTSAAAVERLARLIAMHGDDQDTAALSALIARAERALLEDGRC